MQHMAKSTLKIENHPPGRKVLVLIRLELESGDVVLKVESPLKHLDENYSSKLKSRNGPFIINGYTDLAEKELLLP